MAKVIQNTHFSRGYREACFVEWYQLGQPAINEYWLRMSKDKDGRRPSKKTLLDWANNENWKARAEIQNAEVNSQVVEKTVAEKIEMLERHAETGREIQSMSLEYLRGHAEEITPHAAVRLLQLGIDIERDSVGVPDALKKMQKLDDDALLGEITSILGKSEVTIEQIEAELSDGDNNS